MNESNDSDRPWLRGALTTGAIVALLACGGGGGGESPSVVSGSVVKGPVGGSTVCAYALSPTGKGARIGCTTSAADGSFSLSLSYSGEVFVEAVGGEYTDESTGAARTPLSSPLAVVGTVRPGEQQLVATPLTAMAVNMAGAGGALTLARFDAAAGQVLKAFKLPSDLNLARTVPRVTGETNAYGNALIELSGVLASGVTLAGFIATDPVPLTNDYGSALLRVCSRASATPAQVGPSTNLDVTATTTTPDASSFTTTISTPSLGSITSSVGTLGTFTFPTVPGSLGVAPGLSRAYCWSAS